MNNRRKITI